MIKETLKAMQSDYKVTKKDIFDLFVLVAAFLVVACLECIL